MYGRQVLFRPFYHFFYIVNVYIHINIFILLKKLSINLMFIVYSAVQNLQYFIFIVSVIQDKGIF